MSVASHIKKSISSWKGVFSFKALPLSKRKIIFYVEDGGYWNFFKDIFQALRDNFNQEIIYVTSSDDDPILIKPPSGISSFFIGSGVARTFFFAGLEANVLIMTMPDLQTFNIKRSPYPVKYVYLHHSIVSTHMIYRQEAFDHFDSILCVGPHHIAEIKARENLYNLPSKELIPHGYGKLDVLISNYHKGKRKKNSNKLPQVIIAPSWGDNGLLELFSDEVVGSLLKENCNVVVRPHPRTLFLNPDLQFHLLDTFGNNKNFQLDLESNSIDSFFNSDIMISDWSGAALEFAFGLEKPVIFVDVPKKILNSKYQELDLEPLEVKIRDQIGIVLSTEEISEIGRYVKKIDKLKNDWQKNLAEVRNQWVFNIGSSGLVAANFIMSCIKEKDKI